MLDEETRAAILRLRREGHGTRTIARALRVARNTVRQVLAHGSAPIPPLEREEKLAPHEERIRALVERCESNRVRVQEELAGEGLEVGYSTLTAFCRRRGLGPWRPPERAGRYEFAPGEEMQHDTSPHVVRVGGHRRRLQCASLVLCYSRRIYAQAYPTWSRFTARAFLSQALVHFGGAARRCLIDNSSVIVAHGTGKDAVMAAEMEALAERFGFHFRAHAVGDADRSARVERPFAYIEGNFYPGRTFQDLADLNRQLRVWCEQADRRTIRTLQSQPAVLFESERPHLQRLPLYVPEVYALHSRVVDLEGLVNLHTNRYSVDAGLIGRRVEVRETLDRVRLFQGSRCVAEHERLEEGARTRAILPAHRHPGRRAHRPAHALPPLAEEQALRESDPSLAALVDALRRHHGGRAARAIQGLHRLLRDYPREPLLEAVRGALAYGLLDLQRLERMVLERVAGDFFRLPSFGEEPDDDE